MVMAELIARIVFGVIFANNFITISMKKDKANCVSTIIMILCGSLTLLHIKFVTFSLTYHHSCM